MHLECSSVEHGRQRIPTQPREGDMCKWDLNAGTLEFVRQGETLCSEETQDDKFLIEPASEGQCLQILKMVADICGLDVKLFSSNREQHTYLFSKPS